MENLLFFGWQNNISLEGDWFRLWSSGGYCSIYPSHLPDKTVLTLKRPSGCNWLFSHQLPKSSVHVIKILKKWKWKLLSCVRLFATPWTPWNSPGQNTGVEAFPSPGDLPNPRIEPRPPALQANSLPTELSRKQVKILKFLNTRFKKILGTSLVVQVVKTSPSNTWAEVPYLVRKLRSRVPDSQKTKHETEAVL